MTPTKSTRDAETVNDKRIIKTKHHPLLIYFLAFCPTLSNYFRSCRHLHICSLKQHSRVCFSV